MRQVAGLVAAMWLVGVVNAVVGGSLNRYGILPREVSGLIGIPLAPFLHVGFGHLASNTVPIAVLGTLVAFGGSAAFWRCTAIVAIAGGLGVWLFGRASYHVGASGLVFGYFGYLVAAGWFDRKPLSIVLAVVTIAGYSGLLWGVLPLRAYVSWEGHLFGLLAGVLAARVGRRRGRSD